MIKNYQANNKITPYHLDKKAVVYIRQSTERQVHHNKESQKLQYNLVNRAKELGFKQIEVIDLIGINDKNEIDKSINECIAKSPQSFGEPYIAIRIKPEATTLLDDQRALHSKIVMDYMGKIKKRGE